MIAKKHNSTVSRSKQNEIKEKVYVPIKAKLIKKLGEHTATFILPNRLALELAGGDKSNLLSYKEKLFKSI